MEILMLKIVLGGASTLVTIGEFGLWASGISASVTILSQEE
jgi:hypothetical protein